MSLFYCLFVDILINWFNAIKTFWSFQILMRILSLKVKIAQLFHFLSDLKRKKRLRIRNFWLILGHIFVIDFILVCSKMMKSYKFSILSQSTWHALRNDLVSMLMPLFLMNHPNSMSVMHYAWHGQVSHFNNCKTINYLNNILFKKIHIILSYCSAVSL